MFCPDCRTEFIDGVTHCSDCHVPLVETLPEEPEPEFVAFTEVLATYNPADVAFLKSLLDSHSFQYFFKGEHFMYVRPLADPARLMVRSDQAERAAALLKEVNLSIMGVSTGSREIDDPEEDAEGFGDAPENQPWQKGQNMQKSDHLTILWTSNDPVTSEKMVFMYGINSLLQGWWEKVTIVVWGGAVPLACENEAITAKIGEALEAGVHMTACRACADQLGMTEKLELMGVEVIYWGQPLTALLKENAHLLTI